MRLLVDSPPDQRQKPLETLWKEGIISDNWPMQVLQMLREKTQDWKTISLRDSSERDGRLLY